jgi:hypothetical protein
MATNMADWKKYSIQATGAAGRDRDAALQGIRDTTTSIGNQTNIYGSYLKDYYDKRAPSVLDNYRARLAEISARVKAMQAAGRRRARPTAPADPAPPHITSDQYAAVAAQMYNGGPSPGINYAPTPTYAPPNPSNYTQYNPYNPAPTGSPTGGGGSSATERPRYSRY